jgi:hypothetical protein
MRAEIIMQTTIQNAEVAPVFEAYPELIQSKLMFLRKLILEAASESAGVGEIEETLKWGQPSYLTPTGSTIRIDQAGEQVAMYFICRTNLVETFRQMYPDAFQFEGNRSIIFDDEIPVDALKDCISMALTYHSGKPIIDCP